MSGNRRESSEPSLQERGGYYGWPAHARDEEFEGFVHRILGPDGHEWRWLARSIHGHAADGRTPEAAVENLRAGMEAMAGATGLPYAEWRRQQKADGSRFIRASELVRD
jgi:hypothetical protein